MAVSRAFAAVAFSVAAAVVCSGSGLAAAQSPAPAPAAAAASALTFDVASIHLSRPSPDGHHHIYNDVHTSQFRTGNLSGRDLIQYAYNLPKSQIVGGPEWLDTRTFDIDAKSDAAADTALKGMPQQDAAQQKRLMVQVLLAERFALTVHQETRELPVFALVVAKGGLKFRPNGKVGNTIDGGRSHLHVSGMENTIPVLARVLAEALGRVVVDKTGITGSYDLWLRWTPADGPPALLNGAPDPNAPPDIFTAIQEQLGLKLESAKSPVPVLVIDKIAMPSEN